MGTAETILRKNKVYWAWRYYMVMMLKAGGSARGQTHTGGLDRTKKPETAPRKHTRLTPGTCQRRTDSSLGESLFSKWCCRKWTRKSGRRNSPSLLARLMQILTSEAHRLNVKQSPNLQKPRRNSSGYRARQRVLDTQSTSHKRENWQLVRNLKFFCLARDLLGG